MGMSLDPGQRAYLATIGVTEGPGGALRSVAGREVDPGTAEALLSKATITPEMFQRPFIREGHAAPNATAWIHGMGAHEAMARPGPSGPPEGTGSGTADRSVTTADMAKADLDPGRFHRGYLAAGHEADSPANTGMRETVPMPQPHAVTAMDFQRGALVGGQEAVSPGDAGPGSPCPPDTPGTVLYGDSAAGYNGNRMADTTDHVAMTGIAASQPVTARWAPPADLCANCAPMPMTVAATAPAPGERR